MSTVSVMWLSCSWIPLLAWWVLRNSARFKKNIVIGVTLPHEARDDGQVVAILTNYRRQQLACTIVLVTVALACAAAGTLRAWAGPLIVCWTLWILAACVVPETVFALANHKLAGLKDERGWRREEMGRGRHVTVADIGAAAQPYTRVSGIWFVLICAVSLVPALLDRNNLVVYLLFAACVLMVWVTFRWCYRDRSEVVDDNTTLTQTLTRIRRRAWARVYLVMAASFALMSWAQLLFRGSTDLYLIGMMLPCAVLGIVAFATEMRMRGLQEHLTKASGEGLYVDEDDRWIFGIFYYNPDDAKLMVNERVGVNTSINLARPAGKAIMAALALLLLCLPVAGALMADDFGTPVTLELSGQAIHARHSLTSYEIDMDDVVSIELIDQLPQMTRTLGGAAETFLEGDFSSERYGTLKVCLDPEAGPWLLVRTGDGRTYLLGASDATQTKAVLEEVGTDQR